MEFLAGLIIAVLFTALFHEPLRRLPIVFYSLAALFSIVFLLRDTLHFPPWVNEYLLFLLQHNVLGMGLFTIVMFIGVLDPQLALRKRIGPIRAELSILAAILSVGHIIRYGESYFTQLLFTINAMPTFRIATTVISALLIALLVPLAITSTKFIRKKMNPDVWQRLQRLSYVFYGLVFAHILLVLAPPAGAGSDVALLSIYLYSGIGFLYLVLRLQQLYGTSINLRLITTGSAVAVVLIMSLALIFG